MMQHIDDLLVTLGLILLAVGVFVLAGWVAVVFFAGFVCLIAGVAVAVRDNGRVDRPKG